MTPAVAHTGEFQRVSTLPRRAWNDADLAYLTRELTSILKTPGGTMTLRPVQALALHDAGTEGGLFGSIGVGEGKTIITLLLATVLGCKRPLLLLPAGLIEKTRRDWLALSKHWRIRNELRMFSYDLLGRVQSADELNVYQPDAIICDEVHRLKAKRAAVTRRVARYMYDRPETIFCGASGSIMDRSLKEFAHILIWALKLRAPVPTTSDEIEEWACALDHGVDPLARMGAGALLEFLSPAERSGVPEHVAARRGFQRRLAETPGVVCTIGDGEHVGCSIYLKGIRHKVAPVTEAHFSRLRTEWCTPDGWELSQASDVWRQAQELALGFHYVRVDREKYKAWLAKLNICESGVPSTPENRPNTHEGITPSDPAKRPQTSANTGPRIQTSAAKGPELPTPAMLQPTPSIGRRTSERFVPIGESTSTGFRPSTTNGCISSSGGVALFAKTGDLQRAESRPCTSTIGTPTEEFEVFCATTATLGSATSATLSKTYRERFPTFLETARPPKEWLGARSAWAKFVRETISRSRSLDSELQIANACDSGKLPDETLKAWRAIKDTFASVTVPLWHDDAALRACLDWMKSPGLVWVDHTYFGLCLSSVSGAPYYAEGGLSADGRYIGEAERGSVGIASLSANREGKNLQEIWHRNLVVCPPTSASYWEQMIARTHRPGQLADEVIVDVLLGCREGFDAIMKAIEASKAVQDMTGKRQKLLLADVTLPTEAEIDALRSPRWVK